LNFFTTLGVPHALGPGFTREQDPLAVISDRLWREHFNGSGMAIGKTVTSTESITSSPEFFPAILISAISAPTCTHPWRDAIPSTSMTARCTTVLCIGRLQPAWTMAPSLAEINTIQGHIDDLNPATERG
jgi:hypothetical protein